MSSDSAITEAELLEAIRAACATSALPSDPDGAFVVTDLAAALDWSPRKLRVELRGLMAAGRLEALRVWRVDLSGRRTPVPAYRLI